MDNLKRQQAVFLFDEYNRELAKVYDHILDSVTNEAELASPDFQEQLENTVINSLQPWFAAELDGLADGTPEGFFDSLVELDDIMDVFEIAAGKVDGDMPDLLMLRVGAHGEDAVKRLIGLALTHDWAPEEGEDTEVFRDRIAVDLAAIRVLGQWNVESAVKPVFDRFLSLNEPDEFVADTFKNFVVPFEKNIVPELIARLDSLLDSGVKGPGEYLVICLTELGKMEPAEEIFQSLRRVFRSMDHKVIASICLGDYGDGRAVPLLKGYLDRHVHEIDRQFFYETLSAIKRLGGDITDIEDPFRDFSKRK